MLTEFETRLKTSSIQDHEFKTPHTFSMLEARLTRNTFQKILKDSKTFFAKLRTHEDKPRGQKSSAAIKFDEKANGADSGFEPISG